MTREHIHTAAIPAPAFDMVRIALDFIRRERRVIIPDLTCRNELTQVIGLKFLECSDASRVAVAVRSEKPARHGLIRFVGVERRHQQGVIRGIPSKVGKFLHILSDLDGVAGILKTGGNQRP